MPQMHSKKISWVFDVLSPFAYLGFQQLSKLGEGTQIELVPVLLAGLLEHHGQLGNAEIASKRRFTYRFALWRARKLGVPMTLPPAHPFNPLAALRLIVAAGSDPRAVKMVFDAIFLHGRDVADAGVIAELAAALNIAESALSSPEIKRQLHDNTAWAIARGVFGVPTILIEDELFWGQDAFEMALDFLQAPQQFEDADMRAIQTLPIGVQRRRK